MLKKSLKAGRLISENIHLFMCPVCGNKMSVEESLSLKCNQGHSFDIARSGYINMLNAPDKSKYNAGMFLSRNYIAQYNFFDPLRKKIVSIIKELMERKATEPFFILDAGCGEGSIFHKIQDELRTGGHVQVHGVGIDIAKEGIQIAAREYEDCIWIVGDITRMPFMIASYDCIVNLLSPSNYGEFERVLKPEGILIKVVPEKDYLAEIRERVYKGTKREHYSNLNTIQIFDSRYTEGEKHNVRYTFKTDPVFLKHLVRMTPLTWDIDLDTTKIIELDDISTVTVDLTILVARKKNYIGK